MELPDVRGGTVDNLHRPGGIGHDAQRGLIGQAGGFLWKARPARANLHHATYPGPLPGAGKPSRRRRAGGGRAPSGSSAATTRDVSFRPEGLAWLGADLAPDFSHLAGQVLLHLVPPDETARTVLIRAFLQTGQLLPPFPNQVVQPYQFGFEVRCVSRFAIHCDQSETQYYPVRRHLSPESRWIRVELTKTTASPTLHYTATIRGEIQGAEVRAHGSTLLHRRLNAIPCPRSNEHGLG